MDIKGIGREYNKLKDMAYSTGVTMEEYKEIKNLLELLKERKTDEPRVQNLINELKCLRDKIYETGLTKKFSPSTEQYIRTRSDVLPLAFSHSIPNKITKMRGNNSFAIPFKFTPSDPDDNLLIVMDLNNRFNCTQCDKRGDAVELLMAIENLNEGQALEVLCHIYGYSIPFYHDRMHGISLEYREALKSEDYGNMLFDAEQRLYDKGILVYEGEYVEDLYTRKQEAVQRAFQGIQDPNFKYEEPPQRVILTPNRGFNPFYPHRKNKK